MPKKAKRKSTNPPTEAQIAARKAFGEAARARAEARRANEKLIATPSEALPNSENDDYGALTARVQELEAFIKNIATQKAEAAAEAPQTPQNTAVVGNGSVVGTVTRFVMDPNYYPNPIDRLADEPRLARFAFRENYELGWEVGISQYETADRIRTKEPKFTLKLIVKVFDDETGEATNKRFVILRGIFHEDPDAAIAIAADNGITVDEVNQKDFLDEMRYLRFRDWLIEAFFPTPPPPARQTKEVVIGNKLVELYEVSSESSESMAGFFAKAPKKF